MEAVTKKKFSKEHRKKLSLANMGKKFSKEHRKKLSKSKIGDKNPMKNINARKKSSETRKRLEIKPPSRLGKRNEYRISPLKSQIRTCFKNRLWISDVFTRDDFTCQECFIRGGDLEAHHIKLFSKIIKENNIRSLNEAELCDELWNINNGITLCKKCHKLTFGAIWKQ